MARLDRVSPRLGRTLSNTSSGGGTLQQQQHLRTFSSAGGSGGGGSAGFSPGSAGTGGGANGGGVRGREVPASMALMRRPSWSSRSSAFNQLPGEASQPGVGYSGALHAGLCIKGCRACWPSSWLKADIAACRSDSCVVHISAASTSCLPHPANSPASSPAGCCLFACLLSCCCSVPHARSSSGVPPGWLHPPPVHHPGRRRPALSTDSSSAGWPDAAWCPRRRHGRPHGIRVWQRRGPASAHLSLRLSRAERRAPG
jgi:hypothetical protein